MSTGERDATEQPDPIVDDAEPTKPKRKRRKRRKPLDEQHEPEAAEPKRPRLSITFSSPAKKRQFHAWACALDVDDGAHAGQIVEEALAAHKKKRTPVNTWSDKPSNEPPQPVPPKPRRGWAGASGFDIMLASVDDRIYEILEYESREDEREAREREREDK